MVNTVRDQSPAVHHVNNGRQLTSSQSAEYNQSYQSYIDAPGPNCSTPAWQQDPLATSPTLQTTGEEDGPGTALGIILTILLLSLTITVTVYYRKRFHSLKSQMSDVHYSSTSHNNLGPCQPHHFDNPVYATCRARATTITNTASLNNSRVHNTILKETNKCREKFATLPPGRLRHQLAHCLEEDEMSDDTNSEKGQSPVLSSV